MPNYTQGEKKVRLCLFLFTMSGEKKKTAITDKHCLQNVLILAVWDDVIPVFDHNPKAIFQIYLHYKTVWWKMHLLCSDYRLLQPYEQTFVLSTSPVWTTSSWLWSYLYFTTCYFSCQEVTLTCIAHQMWEKRFARRHVDHKVWQRQTQFNRNIPGIWGKSGWRPCLHIIPPFALFLYTFVPSSSTSQCSVQAKMPKTGLMIWHTAL